ncbi:hypothetical protein I4Q36_05655 [Tuanshanicoccus lijuaniae]|uniref:hypothetical protein n=1 Tax=Aerococcaceae bacterium zg-1292 TaxID=2774330 RepID=UPI0019383F52|nr:hypothetical protein [Aerococcaceae bacterium zg-1292]MBF6625638.1 hypothetical protein [Aerococcaceae bacterium zg-BR9]MBF6977821.1 hypothetical protein [Aerococcaceae bacterium zg-BR22]MBS4455964.1 hypothetical protein [Aerococcaceae bacterium zg-A91]MBS4457716.1 hypothetical protein [Aerococcaceae bacterium zg-BR33]
MSSQSLFEKIVYFVVGTIFFGFYYLLMTEYFVVFPFSGVYIVLSVYFLIAILTFPRAGELLSTQSKDYVVSAKLLMPIAYIIGPVLLLMKKLEVDK